MPRRQLSKTRGATPPVWPLAHWAEPEPGAQPLLFLQSTARRSLASHPAAKPQLPSEQRSRKYTPNNEAATTLRTTKPQLPPNNDETKWSCGKYKAA
jgi:hypothetical protein